MPYKVKGAWFGNPPATMGISQDVTQKVKGILPAVITFPYYLNITHINLGNDPIEDIRKELLIILEDTETGEQYIPSFRFIEDNYANRLIHIIFP